MAFERSSISSSWNDMERHMRKCRSYYN